MALKGLRPFAIGMGKEVQLAPKRRGVSSLKGDPIHTQREAWVHPQVLPTKLPRDARSARDRGVFIACFLPSEVRCFRNTEPRASDLGGHPTLLAGQLRTATLSGQTGLLPRVSHVTGERQLGAKRLRSEPGARRPF